MDDNQETVPGAGDLLARAEAAHRSGDLATAERLYRTILDGNSEEAPALYLLGVLLLQSGRTDEAEGSLRRALDIDSGLIGAYAVLGYLLADTGRLALAKEALEKALALDPDQHSARFNLANVVRDLGLSNEALATYRAAADRASAGPLVADALNSRGVLLHRLGRLEEAIADFDELLGTLPDHVDGLTNLGLALEQADRLDRLEVVVDRLQVLAPRQPQTGLLAARMDFRRDRHAEALARLEPLVTTAPAGRIRMEALFDTAHTLDRLGRWDEAWQRFEEANAAWRDFHGGDDGGYLQQVENARRSHEQNRPHLEAWEPGDGRPAPLFFVGFPHSGSTLLENILAARSDIVSTGDASPLRHTKAALLRHLDASPDDYPVCLEHLNESARRHWRQEFWRNADAMFGTYEEGARLLDKLPLNLTEMALIATLFPDASVFVALRDPRDTCLSCYMQNFQPYPAMQLCSQLATTAALYDAAMGLWLASRDRLPMRFVTYRDEDLNADLAGTLEHIVDDLGLPRDEAMLDDRKQSEQKINLTPSYRDVSNSLHHRSVSRWRHYKLPLSSIAARLAPYVTEFGYDEA